MNQADNDFSTQKISPQLVSQIIEAIKNKQYGSVEIYIQNYNVVQITERKITKIAAAHKKLDNAQKSPHKIHISLERLSESRDN